MAEKFADQRVPAIADGRPSTGFDATSHPLQQEDRDKKRGVLRRTTRADQRTNVPYGIGPAGDVAVGYAPAASSGAAGDHSLGSAPWHSGSALGRPTSFSAFSRTSSTPAVGGAQWARHRHGLQG